MALVAAVACAALASSAQPRTATESARARRQPSSFTRRHHGREGWPMFTYRPGGRSFRAVTYDGHVHTAHSHDAVHPPLDVVALAERASLDVVMLTDHGSSAAEYDVRDYVGPTEPVVGAEIGGRYGHALAWGFHGPAMRRATHVDDMPGLGDAVHGAGGVVVLAHPGWFIPGNWVNPRYYLQSASLRRGGLGEGIDGIEIWNATYPAPTDTLIDDWLRLLDAGVFVPITGGTDFHRIGQVELGSPRNVALCPADAAGNLLRPKRDCVFEAARAGRQFVTEGPIVDLRIRGATFGEALRIGGRERLVVEVRAIAWAGGTLRIRIGHTDVRTYPLVAGRERDVWLPLQPTEDTYVFLEIERPARVEGKPRISLISNPILVDLPPYVEDRRGPATTTVDRIPREWTRRGRRRS